MKYFERFDDSLKSLTALITSWQCKIAAAKVGWNYLHFSTETESREDEVDIGQILNKDATLNTASTEVVLTSLGLGGGVGQPLLKPLVII